MIDFNPMYLQAVNRIAQMAPYKLANLQLPDGVNPIMLAQNEALRGPSPRVREQTQNLNLQLYPDPDWKTLRNTIASTYAVEADHVLCGSGSMELIIALCQAYLQPGDELLSGEYAYVFMNTCAALTGCEYIKVEQPEFRLDVDILLEAVTNKTKLVFIDNPGNPTGTSVTSGDIRHLRSALPKDVLLIVDQAYGEFTDHWQPPLYDLVYSTNTIIFRTLSKAYALAGLRVGWGLFPLAIKEQVRKLMNPSNIGLFNQAAAVAALEDQAYMQETVRQTIAIRDQFQSLLQSHDVPIIPSDSSFVMVNLGTAEQLANTYELLRSKGILTRPMTGYGLHEWLRISIGTEDQMQLTADIITKSLA